MGKDQKSINFEQNGFNSMKIGFQPILEQCVKKIKSKPLMWAQMIKPLFLKKWI